MHEPLAQNQNTERNRYERIECLRSHLSMVFSLSCLFIPHSASSQLGVDVSNTEDVRANRTQISLSSSHFSDQSPKYSIGKYRSGPLRPSLVCSISSIEICGHVMTQMLGNILTQVNTNNLVHRVTTMLSYAFTKYKKQTHPRSTHLFLQPAHNPPQAHPLPKNTEPTLSDTQSQNVHLQEPFRLGSPRRHGRRVPSPGQSRGGNSREARHLRLPQHPHPLHLPLPERFPASSARHVLWRHLQMLLKNPGAI